MYNMYTMIRYTNIKKNIYLYSTCTKSGLVAHSCDPAIGGQEQGMV